MVKVLPRNPRIIFVSRFVPNKRKIIKVNSSGKIIDCYLENTFYVHIPLNLQPPQLKIKRTTMFPGEIQMQSIVLPINQFKPF